MKLFLGSLSEKWDTRLISGLPKYQLVIVQKKVKNEESGEKTFFFFFFKADCCSGEG